MKIQRIYTVAALLIVWTFTLPAQTPLPVKTQPPAETGPSKEPALLTRFSLDGTACDILETAGQGTENKFQINAMFPWEIPLDNLIAEFETGKDAKVFVNNIVQQSGSTMNDFSEPVKYVVKANGNLTQEYEVKIQFRPEFRTDLAINIHPSYNTTYGMVNIGYDGELFLGGKFNNYLTGFETSDSYFVFNGQSNGHNISGYWNILRGAWANRLLLSRLWGIKWGIGMGWMYSRFAYNSIPRYTRSEPGLFTEFDVSLFLGKYLSLDVINQFDLFIEPENGNPFASAGNFYPYYKGGIRFSFFNFIKWLRLYFGVAGLYSHYQKDGINTNIGMFVFDSGLQLNLQFPSLFRSAKQHTPGYVKLSTGRPGERKEKDKPLFAKFTFKEHSDELTDESLKTLLSIAGTLKENINWEIELKVFSKKTGDPVSLLSGSIEKAKRIKEKLMAKGIAENRIQIPWKVSMLDEENQECSCMVTATLIKKD